MLNEAFAIAKLCDIGIGEGILIVLQKQGKMAGLFTSLRPISLLNTIRKIFSLMTQERVGDKVDGFLSSSQSAYQHDRSAQDLIWCHRWLAATAIRYNTPIHVLGLDMSRAFDTISRPKLMHILKDQVKLDEDSLRLVEALLKDTTLRVRLDGKLSEPFSTSIGTPQGDCLSPVLFIVYLEATLRELRATAPKRCEADIKYKVPSEAIYADDTDFISLSKAWLKELLEFVPPILAEYYLIANKEKTDWQTMSKDSDEWKTCKKLGALLWDKADISRRRSLAAATFKKLDKLWLHHQVVSQKVRVELFRAYVEPILLYACGTWGYTSLELESLEAFHRRLLRRAINVRYPDSISNSALYKTTGISPLGVTITKTRWELFGMMLRLPDDAPARQSMALYTKPPGKAKRGAPVKTLPVLIQDDLKIIAPKTLSVQGRLTAKTLQTLQYQAATPAITGPTHPIWEALVKKAVDMQLDRYTASVRRKHGAKRKRETTSRKRRIAADGGGGDNSESRKRPARLAIIA